MNFLSHTFATLILTKLLGLTGTDVIVALIFGVGVDIDHFIKLPLHIMKHGTKLTRKSHLRSFLQEPIMYLVLVPVCVLLNYYVPIIFFTLHLIMDYVTTSEKSPFWPISNIKVKGFIKTYTLPDIVIFLLLTIVFIFLYI